MCDGGGDGPAKETAPPADEGGVGEVSAPPVTAARNIRIKTQRLTEAKKEPPEMTRVAARDTTTWREEGRGRDERAVR